MLKVTQLKVHSHMYNTSLKARRFQTAFTIRTRYWDFMRVCKYQHIDEVVDFFCRERLNCGLTSDMREGLTSESCSCDKTPVARMTMAAAITATWFIPPTLDASMEQQGLRQGSFYLLESGKIRDWRQRRDHPSSFIPPPRGRQASIKR